MRRLMVLPLVAVTVALGACGDGSPAASSPLPVGIAHPRGHDDVVLRVAHEGGFVPVELVFTNLPTLLITGDGTVYEPAPVPAVYPGPLMIPLTTRRLTEDGLQAVLRKAQQLDLLATPRDYSTESNVADAPDTVVALDAGGVKVEHRAYALGIGGAEATPARQDLLDFVTAAGDLAKLAGSGIGQPEPLSPAALRIRATVVDRASLPSDVPPQFVDWPAAAGVRLADAAECVIVTAPEAIATLTAAKQNTYFVDAGITYSLAAATALPGDRPC